MSIALLTIVLLAATGCGSTSSSTVAGPSPAKCAVTAATDTPMFPSGGGTGALSIGAARECSWSASALGDWIVLAQPTEGRGDAKLAYSVRPNPAGTPRRGAISVSGQSVDVNQEAAPCRFSVKQDHLDLPAEATTRDIDVEAPAGCAWTASSGASWLEIAEGASGGGPGRVRVRASANTGAAREAVVTVAGIRVTVSQVSAGSAPPPPPSPGEPPPPGCAFTFSPTDATIAAAGGEGSVMLTTASQCTWTVTSDATWLVVSSAASGSGTTTITWTAGANPDAQSRIAHLTAGGASYTVRQDAASAPDCSYVLSPSSADVSAKGGTASFTVNTTATCAWTAMSNAPWITVKSGASGTGGGDVRLDVAENTVGADRSGTVTVAGQSFTVRQAAAAGPACDYQLAPASSAVAAAGGTVTFEVRTVDGCAWTASSQASWIAVTAGATGSGNGTVTLRVDANILTAARTGTVTVADQVFTVDQEGVSLTQLTLSGTVSALTGTCPSLTFDVGGSTVHTSSGTSFVQGSCSKLKDKMQVKVTGTLRADGGVDATEVSFDASQIVN